MNTFVLCSSLALNAVTLIWVVRNQIALNVLLRRLTFAALAREA